MLLFINLGDVLFIYFYFFPEIENSFVSTGRGRVGTTNPLAGGKLIRGPKHSERGNVCRDARQTWPVRSSCLHPVSTGEGLVSDCCCYTSGKLARIRYCAHAEKNHYKSTRRCLARESPDESNFFSFLRRGRN